MNLVKPFFKFFFLSAFTLGMTINIIVAQPCSGSWVNNNSFTFQCISGQLIGTPFGGDPAGCPINPTYTAVQTNTFTFDNSVNSFIVDFNAFSSSTPGCARMQVKINGLFYPLTAANLVELPTGIICVGSTNILTVTTDGYIITNSNSPTNNGQGRLVFNGVNATSVTFSTNDNGGGTIFTNPCLPVVPIKLKLFIGKEIVGCKAILNWESEIESNVKDIEVLQSLDGNNFKKIADVMPKGSYSNYQLEINNYENSFFKLKIIDLDDQYEYSKIINLRSSCEKISYEINPNPVHDFIKIIGLKKGDNVLILDMLAKTVLTFSSFQNSNKLDVQKLASGVYYIQIVNANFIKANIKFIKD